MNLVPPIDCRSVGRFAGIHPGMRWALVFVAVVVLQNTVLHSTSAQASLLVPAETTPVIGALSATLSRYSLDGALIGGVEARPHADDSQNQVGEQDVPDVLVADFTLPSNAGSPTPPTGSQAPAAILNVTIVPTPLLLSWLSLEDSLDVPPAPPVELSRPPRAVV